MKEVETKRHTPFSATVAVYVAAATTLGLIANKPLPDAGAPNLKGPVENVRIETPPLHSLELPENPKLWQDRAWSSNKSPIRE
jgi:hypothetical protein